MKFRDVRTEDVEQIALLHAASWRHAYRGILREEYLDGDVVQDRRRVWSHRLTAPKVDQFALAAVDGEDILGFACVFGNEDPRWGSMLDNLHVRPDSKTKGIGTQLIARAAQRALERHPHVGFFLWVFEKNQSARGFYERLGGICVETVTADVAGGGQAVECRYSWPDPLLLSMRLDLSQT